MALFIDLVSSSSPNLKKEKAAIISSPATSPSVHAAKNTSIISITSNSSPLVNRRTTRTAATLSSSSLKSQIVDNEEYEKFKKEWRRDRILSSSSSESSESSDEIIESKVNMSAFFESPIGMTKRRASDTFKITTDRFPQQQRKLFKNKLEAISSIRLFMSAAMSEAYEVELRRRFSDRQMGSCLEGDSSNYPVPSEIASFRWKFSGNSAAGSTWVNERMFVIDSEMIWDEYIATRKFSDLLSVYNEPNVLLYFINWKRAAQRHTSALNRQFKQSLNVQGQGQDSAEAKMIPANELENEFFLAAAKLRLQINFNTAATSTQTTVDLMDFVIEITRVVALKHYLKSESSSQVDGSNLNLTIARDIKIKSGKDAKDCWSKVLSQIPRVTPQIADLIISRYPSFSALMEAYDNNNNHNPESLLAELRFDEARRLGPVISARIFNHFRK